MFFDLISNNISMDKTIDRTENSSFRFLILIDCLLFQKITNWVNGSYHGFASKYSFFPILNGTPKAFSKTQQISLEEDGEKMSREEVKMVMENLGIFGSEEAEESLPVGSINELSKLFDEKEPSMEEVKGAFDVFDVNGDGFVDAMELQRVLCILGLKEGEKVESCKKMIESFDENKDGRIDFEEFAKFMESAV